jgi:hypothetical protein
MTSFRGLGKNDITGGTLIAQMCHPTKKDYLSVRLSDYLSVYKRSFLFPQFFSFSILIFFPVFFSLLLPPFALECAIFLFPKKCNEWQQQQPQQLWDNLHLNGSHATRHFFGATTFYQLATLPTVRKYLSDLMLIQN